MDLQSSTRISCISGQLQRSKAEKEYGVYLDEYWGDDIVDLIIITHPDYDHFVGLIDVLDTRVVRQLWYTGYDSAELSSSWDTLKNKIENEERILYISALENYFGLGRA